MTFNSQELSISDLKKIISLNQYEYTKRCLHHISRALNISYKTLLDTMKAYDDIKQTHIHHDDSELMFSEYVAKCGSNSTTYSICLNSIPTNMKQKYEKTANTPVVSSKLPRSNSVLSASKSVSSGTCQYKYRRGKRINEYCSTRPKSGNFCSKHISWSKTPEAEACDFNVSENIPEELQETKKSPVNAEISKAELEVDLQQLDLYELEKDDVDSEYEELFVMTENDVYDDVKYVSEKSSDEEFVLSESSADDIDDTMSQASDNDENISLDEEFLEEE